MGNDCIDVGLKNIWRSWYAFKKGKQMTPELHHFQYYLEANLTALQVTLVNGTYRHGGYRTFIVRENKRREIAVADIPDRIVHRLLYDYLVPIFDKIFIYDAWSCRKGKGLFEAIERAQGFLKKNPQAFVWRADIRKFFDSVDQVVLIKLVKRRVQDQLTLDLIAEVINSFFAKKRERERERVRW